MKNIGIKFKGLQEVKHLFDAKTYRYVINEALGNAAKEAKIELQEEMKKVFDEPTKYTLNSMYFKRDFRNLSVEFMLKDKADQYLFPQIEGGSREQKRSEKHLQRLAGVGYKLFYVPGPGLKLNKYGNIPGSLLVQILSALKAFPEVGYMANVTERSRQRRLKMKRPKPIRDFFITKGHSGIHPGVWEKIKHGRIRPILLFVKDPKYIPRLKFYETITNSFKNHLQGKLNIEWEKLK